MNGKKVNRQKRVISYLENQVKKGIKFNGLRLNEKDRKRIEEELQNLRNSLENKKKKAKAGGDNKQKDKWFIDIYSVQYGYVKRSDRRKNKGKSRKGLKKTKNVSLLKTVVAQDGMITAYKEGRMGLSPKTHAFKLRKDEPFTL